MFFGYFLRAALALIYLYQLPVPVAVFFYAP